MRFIKSLLASAGASLATAGTAMAAVLQDAPIKVDVSTTESHTVWYTNPVWLAIGGIVLVLIIVFAVMAARGRGSNTTVVR